MNAIIKRADCTYTRIPPKAMLPEKDHVTMKFTKGHNSVKGVGGVKVLVLCTSSDTALYLYQVLP